MDGDFDPTTGEVGLARIPPAIAAAIIVVKKKIKLLGDDNRNQHGGYAYVSVDKFYERIGPMMAGAGLALLIDEATSEVTVLETTDRDGKARKTPWLFASYILRFMHESGALALPLRRGIAMPITGPQTYGSAQSFIEKQFLRQVFKVPTGEKDADETAQTEDVPAGRSGGATAQGSAAAARTPPARQQAAPAPSATQADADKRYRELRTLIRNAEALPDLEGWPESLGWTSCATRIAEAKIEAGQTEAEAKAVADSAMAMLVGEIEKRRAELTPPEREV